MGRIRRFLGLTAVLFTMFLGTNAWAADGYYCDADKVYTSCKAGYYLDDGACIRCPAGHYCPGGMETKQECLAGEYNDLTGSEHSSDCAICTNSYSSAGAISCTACPTVTNGWTLVSGAGWTSYADCKQQRTPDNCNAGTIQQVANSATTWGNSTIVSDLYAGADYYVEGTTCKTCSDLGSGEYGYSGADNNGGSSACYVIVQPGYKVKEKYAAPVACPAGEYCPGGNVYYGDVSSTYKCSEQIAKDYTSDGGVTAKSKENCYITLTLNPNGGRWGSTNDYGLSGSETYARKVYYGKNLTFGTDIDFLTREGYSTSGWQTDHTCQGNAAIDMFTADERAGNTVAYACWSGNRITVNYDSDGGSSIRSGSCIYGGTLTLPAAPTKTGSTFSGWKTKSSISEAGATIRCDKTTLGVTSGSVTIKATWGLDTYTATFKCGATEVATVMVEYGGTLTVPKTSSYTACVNNGYNSNTWFEESFDYVKGDTVLTWDLASKAEFSAQLVESTPRYDCNNGTDSILYDNPVKYGKTFTVANYSTNSCGNAPTGYTFGGWGNNGTTYQPGDLVTNTNLTHNGNINLTAVWKSSTYTCAAGQYLNVTSCEACTAGYYCPSSSKTYTYNGSVQGRTACAEGSYTNTTGKTSCTACQNGTTTSDKGQTSCNATCSNASGAYAWETASWSANGMTNACTISSCSAGKYKNGNACATCDSGYTSSNGMTSGRAYCYKTCAAKTGYTLTGGVDYYSATDTCAYSANEYSLSYLCGDEHMYMDMARYNESYTFATAPDDACKQRFSGFTFTGWTCAQTSYDGGETITYTTAGSLTCVADWQPNTYTVSFDNNGADINGQTTAVTATYNDAMPAISTTAPKRDGYIFQGWYDNANYASGTQYYTAAGTSARVFDKTVNTTLYAGWKPITYTIAFDANGGSGTMASITMTYNVEKTLTKNAFTRTNYKFAGWATTSTGMAMYSDGATVSNLTTTDGATVTLYADWSLDSFKCVAGQDADGNTCAAGSYCPGSLVNANDKYSTTSGCERACPSATKTGGVISSEAGAKAVTACYQTVANVVITASGGSTQTGSGTSKCFANTAGTDYNANCTTVPTSCYAGYYRVGTSANCDPVGYGYYRGANEGVDVRNVCSALTNDNNVGEVTTATNTSDEATDCYNTCPEQATTNGTLIPAADKVSFNGTKIAACAYSAKCNSGYSASGLSCTPNVYTITLDHDGGTYSGTNPIYLKYATGWYSNEGATGDQIFSVPVPTKETGNFGGYAADGQEVINASGILSTNYKLFTTDETNITATALWAAKPTVTCESGTYYAGTGSTCTQCPAGSYCTGVTTYQDEGAKGATACASLNGTYTAAVNANGAALTVTVSSEAGAKAATDCFATNVKYAPDNYTAGSQTCKYNDGTKSYTDNCSSKNVITCVAGYSLATTGATNCTPVGIGYYSPEKSTSKTQCPTKNIGTGTTGTETAAGAESCYIDNLWLDTDSGHGNMRARCYYSTSSTTYDTNCEEAEVVACDGGYYYNAGESATDCVVVGDGYYSPAQSECVGEDAEPLEPGCSTERTQCPNGAATGTETASSLNQCEGMCPEGSYCDPDGTEHKCPTDYPNSVAGSTSINQCYQTGCNTQRCSTYRETQTLKDTCNAKYKGTESTPVTCSITGTSKFEGVKYYGTSTCVIPPNKTLFDVCPVISVICPLNYYFSGELENNGYCTPCTDLPGKYIYSHAATQYPQNHENGATACYRIENLPCTDPVCPTDTTGTCTYNAYNENISDTYKLGGGYLFYGTSKPLPGSQKPFTCPATGANGSYWECKTGYDKNADANIDTTDDIEDANPEDLCTPHVYTVKLFYNNYSYEIFQRYLSGWYSGTSKLTKVKVPTLENYTFEGYYTTPNSAVAGAKKVIDADGNFYSEEAKNASYTSDMALYAWWTQNVYQCEAGYYYESGTKTECKAPYYCPGTGTVPVTDTGCRVTCPTATGATGNVIKGETKENGLSDITGCWVTFAEGDGGRTFDNGTAVWNCSWKGTEADGAYAICTTEVKTCDAGYYQPAGTDACQDVTSGHWSAQDVLSREICPALNNYTVGSDNGKDAQTDCYVACTSYKPTVTHSTSVAVTSGNEKMYFTSNAYPACQYTVECETGYTAVSGSAPACNAKVYNVLLNTNGGTGTVAQSVECTFDSGVCNLPATSGLSYTGYVNQNKWCTKSDGSGPCYEAGKNVTSNISSTGDDVELFAIWTPGVFKITLNAPDATANGTQNPVYLKYATGWYSDAAAENALSKLPGTMPSKAGYAFAGYNVDGNKVAIIDGAGNLLTSSEALRATTTDTAATAQWAAGTTHCDAGYYYPGEGGSCDVCTENHYCSGGDFATDSKVVGGLSECPNGGISEGGVNATNSGVCYKKNEGYTTDNTTGTRTCNYDETAKAYVANCVDYVILTCAGGYYDDGKTVDADDARMCQKVGADNYSPNDDTKLYACPDSGNTDGVQTSDALSDCMKRMDTYVSATGNAKGSHVCFAQNTDGTVEYNYNCKIDTVEITWCKGGYWYDTVTNATDCVEVGESNYSPEGSLEKTACPHGGTSATTTASTPDGICGKTTVYPGPNYDGPAVHGSGTQSCLYDSKYDGYDFGDGAVSDGYISSCGKLSIQTCDAGYYWASSTDTVCNVVNYNFYGPVADINNNNLPTGRAACPDNGKTLGDKSANVELCYKEQLSCPITNGSGEQTCNYSASAESYSKGCTTCVVTGCDTGYSQVDGACTFCQANNVCDPSLPGGMQSCASLTGGTHTMSDAGTTDVAYCFADCPLVSNAISVSGRDYYGEEIKDTCAVTLCEAGYTAVNGVCVLCPAGSVCDPYNPADPNNPNKPQTCSDLTGGTHTMSKPGASSIEDCYELCTVVEVAGATGTPRTDSVNYPTLCEYDYVNKDGHPCEMIDGVCVVSECRNDYEMINGICRPCDREHALSYKPGGNCLVATCATGYHPNAKECEADVFECEAPYATLAKQTWNPDKKAFGECVVVECESGYHVASNACQEDEQVCEVENGVGVREWNHSKNVWGECIATKCDPGYTNDSSETNEQWKQCGRCNNMYSANGDLAASSYVEGCEIAACMYEGELYTLENNECRLICDTYSDETGSRKWNAARKKCERTCEPGYTNW